MSKPTTEFTKEEDRALLEAASAFQVGEAISYDTHEALQYSDNPAVTALFKFDSLIRTIMDEGYMFAEDLWIKHHVYPLEVVHEWCKFVEETEARISEQVRILFERGQEMNRNE